MVVTGLFLSGSAESQEAKIEQGRDLYAARKCPVCHAVEGKGGKVGPDLSKIGGRRDPAWLKQFLPNPKALFPDTIMPPFPGSEEELEALIAYLSSLK